MQHEKLHHMEFGRHQPNGPWPQRLFSSRRLISTNFFTQSLKLHVDHLVTVIRCIFSFLTVFRCIQHTKADQLHELWTFTLKLKVKTEEQNKPPFCRSCECRSRYDWLIHGIYTPQVALSCDLAHVKFPLFKLKLGTVVPGFRGSTFFCIPMMY